MPRPAGIAEERSPRAGGSLVHGIRVLGLPDEPAASAMAPGGEEKARAEAG
jgi:hypothetical protein